MSSNVTRRSFFKGAGLAALGGLSAAALSGCGHGYAAAEPTNPSTGDFDGPSWLGAPPVIDEADITETIETEVLVVGMGTGGIPAMISAAENGAKVLGIDRQGTPHNVREDIGAIDSRLQQASFDEFPEFRIEKKEAVEDIVRYANGFVNYDLVKLWADESGAMVDWLTDIIQRDGKLVMEFEGGVGDTSDPGRDKAFATGHSPQKTDAVAEDEEWGFAESILAYAAEQGAETRWYCEFIKCETDESGRVTGVIARDVQGDRHYLRINASRGVILSTGGYGNNLEMMEDRQAWNQKIRIAAPGSGGNPTGSGIKAALWLGATMDPLGAACTFNRACVKPDQYAGDGVLGRWFWFGEQPFLKLNLKGERFCNESGPYDYMLHSTIMQPHQTYVDIWDANHAAQAEAFDEVGCCRLFPFPNGAKNNIPMQVVDGMIEKLIEDGYVQKADTMEELAEKLNLPVETTVASWKHYNEMAAAGEDTDYYKEKHRLMAIDTPPFYGVRTGSWFLATLDGITIDTNMHPCDENGDPIKQKLGNTVAPLTGGFGFDGTLGNFDFNVFFNYSIGNQIVNGTKLATAFYTGSARGYNLNNDFALGNRYTWIDPATGLNLGRPSNTTIDYYGGSDALVARLNAINANASIYNPAAVSTMQLIDYAVEDASFLRVNNITVGYTLPKRWAQKVFTQRIRIYLTGYNLFCLTNYSGADPEVDTSSKKNAMTPGIDYAAYPKSRSFVGGINVTF